MEWLWTSVAIAFLVIELTTKRLVAVWVSVSALIVNLIDAIFSGIGVLWQGAIFIGLSALLILITYPITKRIFNKTDIETEEQKNEQE